MGTRSLTVMIQDEWEEQKEICVLYRQYDGYVEGHGHELAKFLSTFRVVNGLGGVSSYQLANGAGCLFAQIIAHFKDEPGGFYLYPPGSRDEEYVYFVTAGHNKPIHVRVLAYGEEIFSGKPEELLIFQET